MLLNHIVGIALHVTIENSPENKNKKPPMRQRSQSRRAARHGYLAVEGQIGGFPCMVKDISETGATISLTGLMGIPQNFSLFVEPESIRYSCAVTSTKGNSMIVTFNEKEENIRYRDYIRRSAA